MVILSALLMSCGAQTSSTPQQEQTQMPSMEEPHLPAQSGNTTETEVENSVTVPPVEESKPAPAPTEEPKPAPAPTEELKPAPAPTEEPKPAPAPTEEPKPTPAPTEEIGRAHV